MDFEVVRGKPLTKDETKLLLDLIENSPIILSKMTNAASNKRKTEEWVRLTRKFNATAAVCRRTTQQVRLKWENLKKLARKRTTKIRMNRIQTGGGIPEYIPPNYILDRVAALLGSTTSGGGGDGGDDDNSGDGVLEGQAKVLPLESIPVSVDMGMGITIPVTTSNGTGIVVPISVATTPFNTSISLSTVSGVNDTSKLIPETVDNVIEVNQCKRAADQSPLRTPTRLTMSTSRIGKKKLKTSHSSSSVRNIAIAEYYTAKKLCLEAKKENILLQNEKLKLEIEKLIGK